jgi:hypothetical protein
MDSFLDRYISYEYLVSPCPQSPRVPEADSLTDVRSAVERAREGLRLLRESQEQNEAANTLFTAIENDLSRAIALLDNAASKPWLA